LPSGSVVGGAFALGALGALALARKRRRHAYRYQQPLPGRRLTAEPLGPALHALVDAVQAPSDEPTKVAPVIEAVPADDDSDHRERPDFIEIGTRDDEVVSAMLSELAGISFVGDHADWVVRQLVCELFIRSGPLAAEVCTTEGVIERLFPGIDATTTARGVPGLRIVSSDEAVCSLLEGEITARTHRFAFDDAPDVLAYRRTFSWDPMPTVIALVEEIGEAIADRWRAVIEQGPRLGLGVIVLNSRTRGERRVELTGWRATAVDPGLAVIDGVECFGIGPDEAGEIVKLHVDVEERPSSDDGGFAPYLAAGDEEPWPEPELAAFDENEPAPQSDAADDLFEEVAERNTLAAAPDAGSTTAPITIQVFGPYEIAVNGKVVGKGLRMVARELLAWHLLRPEGASIGAAVEGLWPDTDPAAVSNKFWRAASDLRTEIGAAAMPSSKLLEQAGDVYQLDGVAIDCDLWRFQTALRTAARADEAEAARQALREAVDSYGGEFLDGMEWFWVAPVREDLHRRALDAHLRLAELEAELGNPAGAETVLEAATEFDRYAEEPYRRLMTQQAERGRLDAVTATWRTLERRLAEIDVDAEATTLRCYRSLTVQAAPPRGGDESVRRLRRSS
jgi:DNA-binding SARP family transcriptional activator